MKHLPMRSLAALACSRKRGFAAAAQTVIDGTDSVEALGVREGKHVLECIALAGGGSYETSHFTLHNHSVSAGKNYVVVTLALPRGFGKVTVHASRETVEVHADVGPLDEITTAFVTSMSKNCLGGCRVRLSQCPAVPGNGPS